MSSEQKLQISKVVADDLLKLGIENEIMDTLIKSKKEAVGVMAEIIINKRFGMEDVVLLTEKYCYVDTKKAAAFAIIIWNFLNRMKSHPDIVRNMAIFNGLIGQNDDE